MTRANAKAQPRLNRISVRLALLPDTSSSSQDNTRNWFEQWQSDRRWTWSGHWLEGELQTNVEFRYEDFVDYLYVLHAESCLDSFALSKPYAAGEVPVAWLRVRRRAVGGIFALYQHRIIDAKSVVIALGGFIRTSS
jgi:hypothetical protein